MMVVTKNIYFKIAFGKLYKQGFFNGNVCLVDICSCNSIAEVSKTIASLRIPSCYRIVLLGGSDLCSKALVGLNVLSMRLCIPELLIAINKGTTLKAIVKFLNECNSLSIFTKRQKLIINGLRYGKTINEIADELGISAKTVYNRASNAALKINMRSCAELIHILGDVSQMIVKNCS